MYRQEIEQVFANAGWEVDGSFSDYLLIGYSGDALSILAYKERWGTDDIAFELVDHERMLTYWVREMPSPHQAKQLPAEQGTFSEVWDEQE